MIRIQSILVPIDFSENSEKAARYGVELARDRKAKLIFIHVINERLIQSLQDLNLKGYKGDFLKACRDMVHNREEELLGFIPAEWRKDLDVEFQIRKGKPADEIIRFGKENNIDLIIVGMKGRSALEVALIGSVARNVINHAGCPVLVVRPIEHDFVV
jgi:universal stress protein A